jgi:SanA protein
MVEYAVKHGVDPKDVKMDFAGRRTYDSMYRAKHIFGLDKFIVVSQSYHLDRAIFLARHMGIDAYGFASDRHKNTKVMLREVPACVSALVDVYVLHPKPLLGKPETI